MRIGLNAQCAQLKFAKAHYPFLADAPFHALQQTLRDLDAAFTKFFKGKSGYPNFRKRGDGDGFRFPDPKQFELDGEWLKLPKLGWVRLRLSRPVKGAIRNITIAREGEHWFASLCCQGRYTLTSTGKDGVGLDAGIKQDITTSAGAVIDFGAPKPKERGRLARAQRIAARCTKGSRRWRKAVERAGRISRRLAARRRDRAHKESTRIVIRHAFVVLEDLNLKAMTASARGTAEDPGRNVAAKSGLNREMLARGHGDFRRMLTYKCERAGIPLVLVAPQFTSQKCSACGHTAPENRKNQAVFQCVACGLEANADHNAAQNILAAGQAAIARGGRHDPESPSSGQTCETRTHLRDPAHSGLARNPGQSRIAA